MITIKTYADRHGISAEAVRKQIKNYEKQLGDHISKQGRVIYLDEEAEAFLDEHRMVKAVILEECNEYAQEALEKAKLEIMKLQQQIIGLQDEKLQLQEKAGKVELLEARQEDQIKLQEEKDKARADEIALMQAQLDDMRAQRDKAQEELQSFERGLFGFYRKK